MNEQNFLNFMEYMSFDIYDWTLLFAIAFLFLDILNDIFTKRFSKGRFLETLSSLGTQIPFYFSEFFVFAGAVFLYFTIYEYIPWKIDVNIYTALLVLLLADFTYYVEHYLIHKIRLFWVAHSVHHSSEMMNTATAFRFSIFDPVVSVMFHLPLVLMGFNPILIFAGEVLVQAYQFWLHNEMIGKLGPIEKVFNTPSHHRVHHGSDEKYIDKNFGGILIIWDRIFGTFEEEKETPNYGLTTNFTSINPIKVQFYELGRLVKDIKKSKNSKEFFNYLFKGPGWKPSNHQ